MNFFTSLITLAVAVIVSLPCFVKETTRYMPISREQSIEGLDGKKIDKDQLQPSCPGLPYNDNLLAYNALEHLLLNDYEGAIAVYEDELEKNPDDIWLLYSIAEIYCDDLNDWDKAFAYYQKAYDIDPNNPIAIVGYGYIQLVYGNYLRTEKILWDLVKNYSAYDFYHRYYIVEALGVFIEAQYNLGNATELEYALNAILEIDNIDSVCIDAIHAYNVAIIFYNNQEEYNKLNCYLNEYNSYLSTIEYDYNTLRGMCDASWGTELFDYCNELVRRLL